MDKSKISPETLEQATQFLVEHFGAVPDEKLGGLAVMEQRGWILDATDRGWKLSEILAAFKDYPAQPAGASL